MANDPPFATVNHFTTDLEMPRVTQSADWYKLVRVSLEGDVKKVLY